MDSSPALGAETVRSVVAATARLAAPRHLHADLDAPVAGRPDLEVGAATGR
jgi:hypothetical protein